MEDKASPSSCPPLHLHFPQLCTWRNFSALNIAGDIEWYWLLKYWLLCGPPKKLSGLGIGVVTEGMTGTTVLGDTVKWLLEHLRGPEAQERAPSEST